MPPQLHQSWEQPTCGCASHICYGAGSASLQPPRLSLPSAWAGDTEHGAGSGLSPAFLRLCRIKVLLFWTGWVSASPKPWCDGVGGGGTCNLQQITGAALCMAQEIPSLWFLRDEVFSPSNPTLLALTYPQHIGLLCQGELLSWFREGDVLDVPRSHLQPL